MTALMFGLLRLAAKFFARSRQKMLKDIYQGFPLKYTFGVAHREIVNDGKALRKNKKV
jgi:hypothetical protein